MIDLIMVKKDGDGQITTVGVKRLSEADFLHTNMSFMVVNPLPREIYLALNELLLEAAKQAREYL